jgi:hypothetical protein
VKIDHDFRFCSNLVENNLSPYPFPYKGRGDGLEGAKPLPKILPPLLRGEGDKGGKVTI